MKHTRSILPFVLVEAAVLLGIVVLIAHSRSFAESLLLRQRPGLLPVVAPDEGRFILLRSALVVAVLQAAFGFRDLYRWPVIMRPQQVVLRLVEALGIVLVGLPLLYYALQLLDEELDQAGQLRRLGIHPMLVLAASGGCFLAAYGLRMRWPKLVRRAGLGERVAIAGRGLTVDVLEEELRRRHDPGIELVGFLDEEAGCPARRSRLGTPSEAARLVAEHDVRRLVLAPGLALPGETLLEVRQHDVKIIDASAFYEQVTGRVSYESLRNPDLMLASASPGGMPSVVVRRALDVGLASLGLLLASPICLTVAVLVRLDSPGPVFYRQERIGRNGRPFMVAKFRSMQTDAEAASGPVWAGAGDARVTRVGKWLRKLRIDEIPQLWSVIRNDMSLVGPRPERAFFIAELEKRIPSYGQRHVVKPGVTGWAQINYSYGNTVDDAFIKLQYDLYYVKHRSLALDVAILLRTVKVVVLQQGAV